MAWFLSYDQTVASRSTIRRRPLNQYSCLNVAPFSGSFHCVAQSDSAGEVSPTMEVYARCKWIVGGRGIVGEKLLNIKENIRACDEVPVSSQALTSSLKPSDSYIHWQPRPSLFQIMAHRLFGAKPLSELMLSFCQLELKKCIWKCRLRNGGHVVSASMC